MQKRKIQVLEEILFDFYYELHKQNRYQALGFLREITSVKGSKNQNLKMLRILVKYQSNLEQSA